MPCSSSASVFVGICYVFKRFEAFAKQKAGKTLSHCSDAPRQRLHPACSSVTHSKVVYFEVFLDHLPSVRHQSGS